MELTVTNRSRFDLERSIAKQGKKDVTCAVLKDGEKREKENDPP